MIESNVTIPQIVIEVWDRLLTNDRRIGQEHNQILPSQYFEFRARKLLEQEFTYLRDAYRSFDASFESSEAGKRNHMMYLANMSYYIVHRIIENSENELATFQN